MKAKYLIELLQHCDRDADVSISGIFCVDFKRQVQVEGRSNENFRLVENKPSQAVIDIGFLEQPD